MLLVVNTGDGEVLLASSGSRPGMLLPPRQRIEQSRTAETYPPTMSVVPRLKKPGLMCYKEINHFPSRGLSMPICQKMDLGRLGRGE